jgi:hypothetical protein
VLWSFDANRDGLAGRRGIHGSFGT